MTDRQAGVQPDYKAAEAVLARYGITEALSGPGYYVPPSALARQIVDAALAGGNRAQPVATANLPERETIRMEFGWLQPDGVYICFGCGVRDGHEHRCHGSDGAYIDGHACGCKQCEPPTAEELAAFRLQLEDSIASGGEGFEA